MQDPWREPWFVTGAPVRKKPVNVLMRRLLVGVLAAAFAGALALAGKAQAADTPGCAISYEKKSGEIWRLVAKPAVW
jgi:hypothetical protein